MELSQLVFEPACLSAGKRPVRQLVTAVLGNDWPLTAKGVFLKAREHSSEVTYQAVHKALKQLEGEGVVTAGKDGYALDLTWIRTIKLHGEELERKYFNKSAAKGESLHLHDNFRVYAGRERTVAALAQITRRATKGDLIFGQCKTGTDYPQEFYSSIEDAAKAGAEINFIIPESTETSRFVRFLFGLKGLVKGRKACEDNLRVYGRKDGEVMLAFAFPDAYFAIHFIDPAISKYFYQKFSEAWAKSKNYPQ